MGRAKGGAQQTAALSTRVKSWNEGRKEKRQELLTYRQSPEYKMEILARSFGESFVAEIKAIPDTDTETLKARMEECLTRWQGKMKMTDNAPSSDRILADYIEAELANRQN